MKYRVRCKVNPKTGHVDYCNVVWIQRFTNASDADWYKTLTTDFTPISAGYIWVCVEVEV